MKTILISNNKNNINYKKLKKIIIGEWCFDDFTKKKSTEKHKFLIKNLKRRKTLVRENLRIEKKILNKIVPILNSTHKETKNIKQWQVIIGHWLRSYIGIFSNRYKHINQILKKEKIDNFMVIQEKKKIHSNDIKDFLDNARKVSFNDEIYKNILKYKNSKTKYISKLTGLKKKVIKENDNSIKNKIFKIINLFLSKNDNFFISELYLTKIEEILFQLKFNQIPRFWNYLKFNDYSLPNYYLRKNLKDNVKLTKKNLFNFLLENIFLYMPTAYLEDYIKIKEFCIKNYPKKPKAIITANTFYYNESIKNYISQNLLTCKYIVIQHGNNYGSHFDEHFNSIEELTSDFFITWGFLKQNKKYIRGVMQKQMKKNKSNKKNLLIMHFPFELRDKTWDNFEDYDTHIKSIENMLKQIKLINGIKKIIYRIPNGEHNVKSILYLKKITRKIVFDTYKTKLVDNINNSNICLFNYNSSGFYENLSNNIPSLLFINKDYLDEIDKITKNDFLNLHKNNVIHFDVNSLFKFLNENWENLDEWWFSNDTQKAKNIFNSNNAISNRNPQKKLIDIIKKIIN